MITIDSPSMAVNDSRAAVTYIMDRSIRVQPSVTMTEIVREVINQATQIQGRIQNLILTAHGNPGYFQIGTGLDINSMSPFERLRGNVHKIWFRGCLVGRIIDSNTPSQGDGRFLQGVSGNGHIFLSQFARLTHCNVVAATEMQTSRLTLYPKGVIDSWEGLVVTYDRTGNLIDQRRYPSLHGYNPQGTRASNPNRE